jgi:hypothetical protein
VGDVLSAADLNLWTVPLVVIKPADTARNSTTTLAADPDLVLALAANSTYQISGVILYDGPSAGASDLKWDFQIPTGASGQVFLPHQNLSGAFAGAYANNWTDNGTANTTGVGTIMVLGVQGILQTAGSSGNLTFRCAQNTSSGTNDHVKAQSHLAARRIA